MESLGSSRSLVLNRPKALNALTLGMVRSIYEYLKVCTVYGEKEKGREKERKRSREWERQRETERKRKKAKERK